MNITPWRKTRGMPLARESSLSTPISEFRGELDRLFDRFFRGGWLRPSTWAEATTEWPGGEFLPSLDVAENDKEIVIRTEVPGMDPKDVDVSLSGNVLTIHGEKKESSEEKSEDYYHCERRFGSFSRNVELPATADLEHIEAEQRNGLLTITVKKAVTAKPKKIGVKAAEKVGAAK
jgi:HSP20 family protein